MILLRRPRPGTYRLCKALHMRGRYRDIRMADAIRIKTNNYMSAYSNLFYKAIRDGPLDTRALVKNTIPLWNDK